MSNIKLKSISHHFDDLKLFDKLSLELQEKKINVLIGPSGAGKSTLLKIISGIIKPIGGSIINQPQNISYVFQEERLIEEITVYKNLLLVLQSTRWTLDRKNKAINKILKATELNKASNFYPQQLSGSMRQRLSLARAFIYPSDTMIMDEPFGGLDIKIKHEILKVFLSLWNKTKKTVILVSHDIENALQLGNNIFIMSNKPMHIQKQIMINASPMKRHLTDASINKARQAIYNEIKNW